MDAALAAALGRIVLYLHFLVVVFNVAGLVLIPFGGWRDWSFVRIYWLRVVHLTLLFIVGVQALLGRYCFLTLWQSFLDEVSGGGPDLLLDRVIRAAIYWPLLPWAFIILYLGAFILTLWYWRVVPPRR